jgi:hypothetical protein
MAKRRSAATATPKPARRGWVPETVPALIALVLFALALVPVAYGALAEWWMFVSGRWDRPDTIKVVASAAAAGLLCALAALMLQAGGGRSTEPPFENVTTMDVVTMRVAVTVVAALFGGGGALVAMTAIPFTLVDLYCNFGVGKRSAVAQTCRIGIEHGSVLTFGAAGAGALLLAAWLLYASTAKYQKAKT